MRGRNGTRAPFVGGEKPRLSFVKSRARSACGLPGVVDVAAEADGLRQRLKFTTGTTAPEPIAAVARRVALRDVSVDEPRSRTWAARSTR